MIYKLTLFLSLFFLSVLTSCATLEPVSSAVVSAENLPACYVVFDAGSSGTRLYIYEKQADGWFEHVGPKVSALADPVREFRGKKHSDIEPVTTEVVETLEQIKQPGPLNDKGKNKWQAFDWSKQCRVMAAMASGTGGMRIAEQKNRDKTNELLTILKRKLQEKLGESVKISVRTLTDYEEGLYTWLAMREVKQNHQFGIVEMGGASTQVTFPCPSCAPDDDAVKTIMVNGQPMQIYSYSFLGMGEHESPKSLGIPDTCVYGIGTTQPDWKPGDCAKKITLADAQGIRDPYNFNHGQQGTHRLVPIQKAAVNQWYLTGTFIEMDDQRVNDCCFHKSQQCALPELSCFRPIYFDKYLQTLNIPPKTEKMDVSWTPGMVICEADNCLAKAAPLVCRWSKQGCL